MTQERNSEKKKFNKKNLAWIIPLAVVIIFALAMLLYTSVYYRADGTAKEALKSDDRVTVTEEDFGWFFDGPGTAGQAMIFFPGGKVEETSYAPLLRILANNGVDVFLLRAPMKLVIFNYDKAGEIMKRYDYRHWYLAGHSLGGTAASFFAAEHGDRVEWLFLLASYSTEELPKDLKVSSLYGSEDGVLNMNSYQICKKNLPEGAQEYVIEGGNHSQFGSYGHQRGDGEAKITSEEQTKKTAELILQMIMPMG